LEIIFAWLSRRYFAPLPPNKFGFFIPARRDAYGRHAQPPTGVLESLRRRSNLTGSSLGGFCPRARSATVPDLFLILTIEGGAKEFRTQHPYYSHLVLSHERMAWTRSVLRSSGSQWPAGRFVTERSRQLTDQYHDDHDPNCCWAYGITPQFRRDSIRRDPGTV
jgi:hypothetical protein